MSTASNRLEKLFKLLEDGKSLAIKEAAASQISGISKGTPILIPVILRKIQMLLYNKDWDTRVAASKTLNFLTLHISHYSPKVLAAIVPSGPHSSKNGSTDSNDFALQDFDVLPILDKGSLLLESSGQAYDPPAVQMSKEEITKQRGALKARLGLKGAMSSVMETDDFVDDKDLATSQTAKQEEDKAEASRILSQMKGLSARERNQLKRKQKAAALQGNKKQKLNADSGDKSNGVVSNGQKPANIIDWETLTSGQWPFQRVADCLVVDCLHQAWETRHGAALALRELLRAQADYASVFAPISLPESGWALKNGSGPLRVNQVTAKEAEDARQSNRTWLEDCIVHLLCVLALDRFADFVSDQAIAPVRETAAQALGVAARPLPDEAIFKLADHLEKLTHHNNWNVQHAGLLGIKYLLVARSDLQETLLSRLMPALLQGLKAEADDVRAGAAEALLPAASVLSQIPSSIESLKIPLFGILSSSDDLSSAPGSAIALLSEIYNTPTSLSPDDMTTLCSKLYLYFRHSLTSVRQRAMKCFLTLLSAYQRSSLSLPAKVLETGVPAIFLNLLLEDQEKVLSLSEEAWRCIMSQLEGTKADSLFTPAKLDALASLVFSEGSVPSNSILEVLLPSNVDLRAIYRIAKLSEDHDEIRTRFACSTALALTLRSVGQAGNEQICHILERKIENIRSASDRQISAIVCLKYLTDESLSIGSQNGNNDKSGLPSYLLTALQKALTSSPANRAADGQLIAYQELSTHYKRVHTTGIRLLKQCLASGVDLSQILVGLPVEKYVKMLTADNMVQMLGLIKLSPESPLLSTQANFQSEVKALVDEEFQLHNLVKALTASAVIKEGSLPARLNLVIQPLMASLRKEQNVIMRETLAKSLAQLIFICHNRQPSPNDKLVSNLVNLLAKKPTPNPESPALTSKKSVKGDKKGQELEISEQAFLEAQSEAQIAYEGAKSAMEAVCVQFGKDLLTLVPSIQKIIIGGLQNNAQFQETIKSLHTLIVLAPKSDAQLDDWLLTNFQPIIRCLVDSDTQMRDLGAKCIAIMVQKNLERFMPVALSLIYPLMENNQSTSGKLGSVKLISEFEELLHHQLVPYLFLLIMPIMRIMNSQDLDLRILAAPVFARLIGILPLVQGVSVPTSLKAEQQTIWLQNEEILLQLLDGSKAQDVPFEFPITGEPRQYQKEGISWMAFLGRCGLHGVLADDMGLGKTLQATLVLAASHFQARRSGQVQKPSLVICPPILVGHWTLEINKFVGKDVLLPLGYEGSIHVRTSLQKQFQSVDVVIMSYDMLRADSSSLLNHLWNYCILDEGHAIRNPKAKITQAVKQVRCQHRLILSGTPIQNNVQELWALFDFLMPGFLGSEAAFNSQYGKALSGGRTAKSGSIEAQKALLAMDGLHKQVAPFILRRTKDTVLKDLPPKIIQDIYCKFSPLQEALYEEFLGSDASQSIQNSVESLSKSGVSQQSAPHIFQALQYMRKLCSHPLMVLDSQNPVHNSALLEHTQAKDWNKAQNSVHDLHHAPKLQALQQLLEQCGICSAPENGIKEEDEGEREQILHRVLVFAQYKALLDIVETDVMRPFQVPFLRLDGSVEPSRRFPIVQEFNENSKIPVMLLTTGVGGLGLNLTTADTVIFLEHDWNPMKDMQAMDRAHRIGQKNTVNVYRLLMKDSLEERVLGLQRFKVDIANAVINEENASGASLLSGAVLDLLGSTNKEKKETEAKEGETGLKSMLAGLDALWDEQQYAEEFSIANFANQLKK